MGRHDDDSRRRDDAAGDAGAGGEVSMSIEETNRCGTCSYASVAVSSTSFLTSGSA